MINRGVAFGIWQGIPFAVIGIFWVGLFILEVISIYAGKKRELTERFGAILILIGGGMNIYDRMRYGGVRDELNLGGVLYNNVWDYLIVVGLVIYGYSYFVRRSRDSGHRQA